MPSTKNPPAPDLATRLTLTIGEACAVLGMSKDHFNRHVRHQLRWIGRGSREVVSVDELRRWVRESQD